MSNGFVGAAAMIYNRPTIDLKAKKSWFLLDNIIVCLGSDIFLPPENNNGNQVSTTITQVCTSS